MQKECPWENQDYLFLDKITYLATRRYKSILMLANPHLYYPQSLPTQSI